MKIHKVFLFSVGYPKGFYKAGDSPEMGVGYLCETLKKNNVEYQYLDMNLGYTTENKNTLCIFMIILQHIEIHKRILLVPI